MDFFEAQRNNRLRSTAVLGLFVFALVFMALAIHLLANMIALAAGESMRFWELSSHAMILIGGVWLTVALGAFFRWLDVRGGGVALARRFRADPVLATSRADSDRLLLDVVAEMAVASNQPVPGIWVLRNESSINGFVIGRTGDVALVISQGALDLLDEEELRGVVAHEFGHLAQGDLPLNMRLMVILGGLLAIDEVGRLLTGRDPTELFHPGVLVGFVLRALGSIGVVTGSLIRSAFSRRREYLADACAVQFTRDSYGLASALDQIGSLYNSTRLNSAYAGELAHLCFHSAPEHRWWGQSLFAKWLATHPGPVQRINAIEPHFQIKKRKQSVRESRSRGASAPAPVIGGSVRIIDNIADASGDFSDRFNLMVSDSTAGLAALFALFAPADPDLRERYMSDVGFSYNADFSIQVKSLNTHLRDELTGCPLAVIRHVKPLLKDVQSQNRQRFLNSIESILKSENRFSVGSYATLRLLRHELNADFPVLESVVGEVDTQGQLQKSSTENSASKKKVKKIADLSEQIALLLALIIEAAETEPEVAAACYKRVLLSYTSEDIPIRSSLEPGVTEAMEVAFDQLQAQPQLVRQAFINHCAEIVLYDGVMVRQENILLLMFAAALDIDVGDSVDLATAA